ncbi:MAG TPA: hypothetical protein VGU20_07855 [Stellaceae bacterium]|nr:hypothetical protein [Stellaceae bacterium]
MQKYPTDHARKQLQRLLKINAAVSRFLRRLKDRLASQKRVLGGVNRGRKNSAATSKRTRRRWVKLRLPRRRDNS